MESDFGDIYAEENKFQQVNNGVEKEIDMKFFCLANFITILAKNLHLVLLPTNVYATSVKDCLRELGRVRRDEFEEEFPKAVQKILDDREASELGKILTAQFLENAKHIIKAQHELCSIWKK